MNQPDDDEEYRLKKVRESRFEKQRTRSIFQYTPFYNFKRTSFSTKFSRSSYRFKKGEISLSQLCVCVPMRSDSICDSEES